MSVSASQASSRLAKTGIAFALTLAAFAHLPVAQAASLYWDSDANGANNVITGTGLGGAGSWNNSLSVTPLLNWWPGSGTTDQSWVNANNDTAVFTGTAGTVTLTDSITVGGLQFNTTAYTLSTGVNTLSFGGANNVITLNNVAAATITGTVGGTGNVALVRTSSSTGTFTAGTLNLNGASAGGWSGTTSVGHGTTLALSATNQGLLNTSGITLNGGTITLTNVAAQAALDRVSNTAAITSNGGTLTYANTATTATNYAETIGSVALTAGKLNVTINTANTGTETQTLTLAGLTRPGALSTVAFSAASTGPNATTSMIKVTGATATTAGQIIGPWATVGTTAALQTDYAVYDASTNVVGANIAGTAQTAWTTAGNSYTQNSALETLGATRTITALRNTGATATTALGASSYNLETLGLLNGATTLWTISNAGTGVIRQQGTAAANLYVNAGAGAITINSVIANNTGALTLVKTGSSTLTLGAVNTYTGDTVIQEGDVTASVANAVNTSNLVIGSSSGGSAASFTNSGSVLGLNSARNLTVYSNGTANFGGGAQNLGGTVTILGGTVNGSQVYLNSTATMTGGNWAASTFSNNNFTTLASADTALISGFLSGSTRTLTVADGAAAVDLLVSGQMTSTTGVTKAGAGLMIVSGNNNYTGTTTVNAGTLQAGRTVNAFGSNSAVVLANTAGVVFDLNGFDNTIGSLATGGTTGGNVTLGSAILTMGGNNTSTSYAGAISGTGGLTKVGTGTQTLTGLNTYTGATTVNGGTLVVDTTTNATVLNSSSGLAVGGGTFQLKGKAATARTQILNGLTVNVGNSVVDVNNLGTSTTLDLSGVSGTAGITHVAGGTVDFRATTGTFGTTAIVKTGQANDSTGMLGTWATVNGGADFAANNGSGIIVAYTGYTALDAQAGGSNPVLNDGTTLNYRINAAGVSGAIALGAATTNINSLSQNISTASTIDTSSGTLRVGTVGGFLITPTGADLTIGTSAGSGIVTAGGNATDVAGELVLTNNSANTLTINSNVTDNGTGLVSVTKSGSGLATLAGTNTFTGGVTINAGVLQLNSAGALNATSSNAVTFGASSTGTLRLNGNSVTVLGLDTNAIAGTPVVENASATGATLTVSKASGTSTYAGVMRDGIGGGALSLTKSGAGTLVVTGANTYTGTTTVTAGTLRAGVGSVANVSGAFGNNSAVILANTAGVVLDLASFSTQLGSLSGGGTTGGNITLGSGTLTIGGDNTSPAAYAGVISGTGELVKIGTGTLILSGANTYTGAQSGNTRNTTIKAGTLVVGANAPSGSAGALGNSTTAVLLGDTTGSQNAALLTNGAFTIGKGINVQAGNTGLISLGGNQTSGTSTYSAGVALNKDTTLTAAAGGQVDFNGIVSGASNVTVDGGGTVKLAGVNTFGGAAKAITIQNGTTLQVGADNNLGNASNGLVFNNGTLKFGAAFDPTARTTTFNSGGASFDTNGLTLSFANAVGNSGTGGLKKLGAGTLNLNAVNTYTGDTIISAGTLALGASGAINANSAITVAAGATFDTTAQSYTFSTAKTTTISVGATSAGLINSAALTFSSAKLGFDFGSTTTLLASYTVLVKSGFTGYFSEVNATGTSISGSFLDAGSGNWTLTSGGYDITFSQSSGMLTAVVSSVPEPATYAALFGTLVLAGAVWQRRRSVRR